MAILGIRVRNVGICIFIQIQIEIHEHAKTYIYIYRERERSPYSRGLPWRHLSKADSFKTKCVSTNNFPAWADA